MAAILGPRALIDIAVPTGVDAGQVMRFELEDGMAAQEVITNAAAIIGEVNNELNTKYGGLWYITDRSYARERQGENSRSMTPLAAEFADPDGVRSDKVGHMLPRHDYKDAVSWSTDYLKRANREDVADDLRLIAERWRNRVDLDVLTRLLTNTENQIGTAGWDVPWAIGTGTNVNFIPPQWRGYIFGASHTHFVYKDSASKTFADLFEDMVQELHHHGHSGRLQAIVSDADIATIKGITGFVALAPFTVVGVTNATAPIQITPGEIQGIPGELFGYYNSARGVVELRYHERVPTGYAWMTKSYGVNDPRNGLNLRVERGGGFGLTVDPQINRSMVPKLDKVIFPAVHGVGIGDRTNGVAGRIASGISSYANPTIS